jgi:hypothetical protein
MVNKRDVEVFIVCLSYHFYMRSFHILGVGTPDYPSGIPDMHTIHDPMISVL